MNFITINRPETLANKGTACVYLPCTLWITFANNEDYDKRDLGRKSSLDGTHNKFWWKLKAKEVHTKCDVTKRASCLLTKRHLMIHAVFWNALFFNDANSLFHFEHVQCRSTEHFRVVYKNVFFLKTHVHPWHLVQLTSEICTKTCTLHT